MTNDHPIYTPAEALARETFLALMNALSHPGKIFQLPPSADSGLIAIGQTLLDLETTFYTPDADLAAALSRTGARTIEADRAAYLFYPQPDLTAIQRASIGTMLFPDHAATLVIAADFTASATQRWTGPGIQTARDVTTGGLPADFWTLRQQMIHYPLGWDAFLVDSLHVIGLPRTTQVKN